MNDLTLIVLAAGLGSRFGGVKQVAAIDDCLHTLIDYGVYDAIRAGFTKVVCVVTEEIQRAFHERIGCNIERHVDLAYAYQAIPAGRAKPWGTAEAVLQALPQVGGDFATMNADDFYGSDAYAAMASFLSGGGDHHGLIGYRLCNTMSEFGTVSRGVCEVAGHHLTGITERKALRSAPGGAVDEAGNFFAADTLVSMNFWGFRASAVAAFRDGFEAFRRQASPASEFYLPDVGGSLIPNVVVLPTHASWMGVTYAEDLPAVRMRIAALVASGQYPPGLWQ